MAGLSQTEVAPTVAVFVLTWVVISVTAQEDGSVRLVDGPGLESGRVEIFHAGRWGTVCADGWDHYAAEVVCDQLGMMGGWPLGAGYFRSGEGQVWLSDLECYGDERRLVDCQHAPLGENRCSHLQDVGVACEGDLPMLLDEGKIRLSGGNLPTEGYVEIYHAGSWGHVCDESWGEMEANVVCKELGYFRGFSAVNRVFNTRPTRYWLQKVTCEGHEVHLRQCRRGHWGRFTCSWGLTAAVACEDFKSASLAIEDIRLAGSKVTHRGRVEVRIDGEWGTVCDDGWDDNDAIVVCRQLGYLRGGIVAARNNYGPGEGVIWLSEVNCAGDEASLATCPHAQYGNNRCTHNEDATVMCIPK